MSRIERLLRAAYYGLLSLPVAFADTSVRARVTRRVFREPFELESPGLWRAAAHTVLAAATALLSWFALFLALVGALRGVAYPLIAAHDYQNSWGGPTLAGAWAVHGLLGVGLLPLWILLLAGFGAVQRLLTARLLGRLGPWWPIPAAVVLSAAGALFFIAWLHQT
ncbi:hypothetical protein GFY24_24840 [Nocardia sp. SYP-A9097]|uniref:hypothetical protein n=1 Tax=Nocardia sp. SYP-A9097 TaxID=2663237 RepID=UPI00129AC8EF|nr:hypothetical protein [Nocardia sp. SYP-A9097]MRH90628.1 hypothetical protein [Nocardia sp. SYP-A9097]